MDFDLINRLPVLIRKKHELPGVPFVCLRRDDVDRMPKCLKKASHLMEVKLGMCIYIEAKLEIWLQIK